MRVNIQETVHRLRLCNMNPGVLFEYQGVLYIRTNNSGGETIKAVNVKSGHLAFINKDVICLVRDDLHITNRKDKDED